MTGYEIQGIDEGLSFERDGIREKMWEAICELDEAMECLKEKDPDTYDEAIRDIHEVFAVLIIMSISLRWTWRQCTIKASRGRIRVSTGTSSK